MCGVCVTCSGHLESAQVGLQHVGTSGPWPSCQGGPASSLLRRHPSPTPPSSPWRAQASPSSPSPQPTGGWLRQGKAAPGQGTSPGELGGQEGWAAAAELGTEVQSQHLCRPQFSGQQSGHGCLLSPGRGGDTSRAGPVPPPQMVTGVTCCGCSLPVLPVPGAGSSALSLCPAPP